MNAGLQRPRVVLRPATLEDRSAMFEWLAAERGIRECLIRPSRRNGRAVRAYLKAGFVENAGFAATLSLAPPDYNDTLTLVWQSSWFAPQTNTCDRGTKNDSPDPGP